MSQPWDESDQRGVAADEALEALLGDRRAGDPTADLLEALREAMRRRGQNTAHGGAVIAVIAVIAALVEPS